ncbi:unnamed protein product [Cuscuta epithymum]|uniref:Uncharacterized protein n=1 Tax=Cuscuta epithymum TaxID=186058 RepID=A0AAV0EW49_9ASTE|nr:unnamed protein product [Cuscuta epithymum]
MEAEQLILFQRQQDSSQLQPAFGVHVAGAPPVQAGQQPYNGAYRGRGGRGRSGRGRGGRGRGRSQNQGYGQPHGQPNGFGQQITHFQGQQLQPQFLAAGGASHSRPQNAPSGKSVVSTLNINAKSTIGTYSYYAGFPSSEGILGSVPSPVVCQICFSAGHSALHCPSRFSQSSAPALVAPSGESNNALWYPDSGASAHMTSSEGQNFEGSSTSGAS